jgi:hypothetical protein
VTIGATSSRSLTVRNGLSSAVSITAIDIQGTQAAEYQLRAITLPLVIAAGGEAVLQADFAPAAEGPRTAELSITLSDGHSALHVPLSGVGSTVQTAVDALVPIRPATLEAHPRPASSVLLLRFEAEGTGILRYRMLDIIGREVLGGADAVSSHGERVQALNVSVLLPGLYVLLVERGQAHGRTNILITR